VTVFSDRRAVAKRAVALLLGLSAALLAEEMPPTPKGFSWKRLEAIKAAFLMPDGWHFKEEEKQGARGYFISQEDIDVAGSFETGLTINVQTFKRDKAVARAAQVVAALSEANEVLHTWTTEAGVLKGFGCRVRETEKGHPPLIMHALAIGNERTNTLYLLIFESPEASWDKAWAKGQVMLEKFLLDDEI
jgi:hypothetical protein